jgi:hypothetical protein
VHWQVKGGEEKQKKGFIVPATHRDELCAHTQTQTGNTLCHKYDIHGGGGGGINLVDSPHSELACYTSHAHEHRHANLIVCEYLFMCGHVFMDIMWVKKNRRGSPIRPSVTHIVYNPFKNNLTVSVSFTASFNRSLSLALT